MTWLKKIYYSLKRDLKAKGTLENIQKLNFKQWTLDGKNLEKCLVERKLEPQHLGPTFECDQYDHPRLKTVIKQPVWVHNRRKILKDTCIKTKSLLKIRRYLPFPIPIPFKT